MNKRQPEVTEQDDTGSAADASANKSEVVVKMLAHRPGRHTSRALNKRTTSRPPDAGLTPKVRAAIELMVVHSKRRQEAALMVGLTDAALFQAFLKPSVREHYERCLDVYRSSLKARAVATVESLMDGAASESIRLQAAKYLDGQEKSGLQINIGVQTNVAPGYITDARSGLHHGAAEILQRAGSVRNVEE